MPIVATGCEARGGPAPGTSSMIVDRHQQHGPVDEARRQLARDVRRNLEAVHGRVAPHGRHPEFPAEEDHQEHERESARDHQHRERDPGCVAVGGLVEHRAEHGLLREPAREVTVEVIGEAGDRAEHDRDARVSGEIEQHRGRDAHDARQRDDVGQRGEVRAADDRRIRIAAPARRCSLRQIRVLRAFARRSAAGPLDSSASNDPASLGPHRAVGLQLEPAVARRPRIDPEVLRPRRELYAGGRRRHHADGPAQFVDIPGARALPVSSLTRG